ncbi:MAG: NYN domain-containing protein [Candidatus Omnitrophota bacterium]
MSLHYVLDGYNIIKQLPSQSKKKLKFSRNALIQFIEENRPQGSNKNKVTVVFDGKEDILPYKIATSSEVIFTKNESADDRIKKIVEKAKNPKQLVVVTDDRELRFSVRLNGAKLMSVVEFISAKNKGRQKEPKEDREVIPVDVERAITEELKNIWLK